MAMAMATVAANWIDLVNGFDMFKVRLLCCDVGTAALRRAGPGPPWRDLPATGFGHLGKMLRTIDIGQIDRYYISDRMLLCTPAFGLESGVIPLGDDP